MLLTPVNINEDVKECNKEQMKLFKQASYYATKSNVKSHRHGCVIVKDGNIITDGYNHYINYYEHTYTIHAEVHALSKLKHIKNNNGCELYVVRIGTDSMGNPLKYSRPCNNCTKMILKMGIKKVYYSTNDEFNEIYQNYMSSRKNKKKTNL